MGRPPKHGTPMTNAERQKVRWIRLRKIEAAAQEVAADLARALAEPATKDELKKRVDDARQKLLLAGGWPNAIDAQSE